MKTDNSGFPLEGPFTVGNVIGGRNGEQFTECRIFEGIVVKKLGVWSNKKGIAGLKVTYSDDSVSKVYGSQWGNFDEITIAPKETIKSAKLWGNGKGTRFGHIELHTSDDQTFDHGKDVDGQNAYPTDVGSGILAGVCGRSGVEIDCLGLIFVRSVASMTVNEVKYAALPKSGEPGAPKPVLIDEGTIANDGESDLNWGFTNKVTLTQSHAHSLAWQWHMHNKLSVKYTFEAGIPLTHMKTSWELGAEVDWGFDRTSTNTDTYTTTKDLTWNIGGVLKTKGKPIYCKAISVQGKLDINYSWKRTCYFTNPTDKLSFTETGTFTKEEYLSASAQATNDAGETLSGTPIKLPTSTLTRLPVKLDKPSVTISQGGKPSENRAAAEEDDDNQNTSNDILAATNGSDEHSAEPQMLMAQPPVTNKEEVAPGFQSREFH